MHPAQIWFLVMLASVGIQHVIGLYRHVTRPSPSEVQAGPDADQAEPPVLLSAAVLALLIALAGFSFTQAAGEFVRSESFPGLAANIGGLLILFHVLKNARRGSVPAPYNSGVEWTREEQPKRFWAVLWWNAMLSAALLIFSVLYVAGAVGPFSIGDLIRPERRAQSDTRYIARPPCDTAADPAARGEPGQTCSIPLPQSAFDAQGRIDPLRRRFYTHLSRREFDRASADLDRIAKIDPQQEWLRFNRAQLAFLQEDYARTVELTSQILTDSPRDRNALRLRADAYWAMGEIDKARDDDDLNYGLAD